MSTAHSAKKRKRSLSDEKNPDSLYFELSTPPDTQIGPVLGSCSLSSCQGTGSRLLAFVFDPTASFPCLTPPANTAFNIFVSEQDEGKEFVKRSSTISGETPAIEFSGSVQDGSEGTGSRCVPFVSSHGMACLRLLCLDTSSHSIGRGHRNLFCSLLRCILSLATLRLTRTSSLRNPEVRRTSRRVAC